MKKAYLVMGTLLLLGGGVGLVQNPVLGLFEVNLLLNLIHLGSGVLTVAAAFKGIGTMRTWGKLFGFFYLAVAIAGSVVPQGNFLGLMHLNVPDNVLHVILALFFLYYGLLAPPK